LILTVSDLMSTAPVVVAEGMSLQTTARLLSRSGVSGAPVVNTQGRCVGVISATDFLRWAEKDHRKLEPTAACDSVCAWQIVETENLPEDAVRDYMTADPVTVGPTESIGELARMMLDARIHRVIVVDAERRPVGVVSSTDLLAALAQADAVQRLAATAAPEGARRSTESCNH
jgi:CBS domain-containing protein